MRVMTDDRITHVIEVRHLHFIEQDGIFEFAGVSHDYAVADDHVLAHVAAAANVAVLADPRRAFQHCPLFNDRSSADGDMVADKRLAHELAEECRLEAKLQITGALFERVPNVILVFEQLRMSRVFEIEKIGGRKHFRAQDDECIRWLLVHFSASRMAGQRVIAIASFSWCSNSRSNSTTRRAPKPARETHALSGSDTWRKLLAVFRVANFPAERGNSIAQFVALLPILF